MQFLNNRRYAFLYTLTIGLTLIFGGCSHAPKVLDPGKRGGFELGEFKRYEKNMERDFWHHCRRRVYEEPSKRRIRKNKSELQIVEGVGLQASDRAQLLEELGNPSLIRKAFESREGEKIEEWVFRDAAVVAQFIDGQLVYQGPLTDLEGMLIIHGYPDHYTRAQVIPDSEIQVLSYKPVFSSFIRTYKLVDDILAFKQEGK